MWQLISLCRGSFLALSAAEHDGRQREQYGELGLLTSSVARAPEVLSSARGLVLQDWFQRRRFARGHANSTIAAIASAAAVPQPPLGSQRHSIFIV